jgi:hypothetical protein
MKHAPSTPRLLIAAAVSWLCANALPLAAQGEHSHMHSYSSNGHRALDVLIDGDVVVNADATDIARLAPGSYMSIEETASGKTWRVRFTPGVNGSLRREYWLNEAPSTLDVLGAAHVQQVIQEVIREQAIGAEVRVKSLIAKGGVNAALKDIADVHSDNGQRKYYTILSEQSLKGDEAAKAIEQAMHNMHSDGDRSRVLFAFMMRRDLPGAALVAVLKGAERLNSDGDKSRVLERFAAEYSLDDRDLRSAFFSSADRIRSDGDKRRVLTTVLRTNGDRKPVVQDVVLSARAIDSDGDKSFVLLRVPGQQLRDRDVYKQYLETLKTINSSGDRSRVQSYLLRADAPAVGQGTR